jgi:hypothetical protein
MQSIIVSIFQHDQKQYLIKKNDNSKMNDHD